MRSLHYLLAFFLVGSGIFVEISSHPHKKVFEIEKSCAKDHTINITLSEYIFNGTKDIKDKIGKDKLPCAVGCFLRGFGMITDQGSFDTQRFLSSLPHLAKDLKLDAEAENAVKSCDKIKAECPCDIAKLVAKCLPPVLIQYFEEKQWL